MKQVLDYRRLSATDRRGERGSAISVRITFYISAYLATFLSFRRARHFSPNDMSKIRGGDLSAGRLVFPDLRLAFGPLDFRRRHAERAFARLSWAREWRAHGLFLVAVRRRRQALVVLLLDRCVVWVGQFELERSNTTLAGPHAVGRWMGAQNFVRTWRCRCSSTHWILVGRTGHSIGLSDHVRWLPGWRDPWVFVVGRVETVV